ncbi:MAG: RNA polymerase sigma factor [Pseudonocardiaceae bacterium]
MIFVEQPGSEGAADPALLHDFIDFYKTTVHRTFSTAYRAAGCDSHVAQDATQEAYVVMLKRWLDNEKPEGDVCRYVVGIAVRKVVDFYRSRGREVSLGEEHDWGSHESGYDKVLDTMTILPVVRDLLDRQPLQRRAVGVLYFLEEFSYPEIAETLGMSCSTARAHVQRLREALQPVINRITPDDRGGERP